MDLIHCGLVLISSAAIPRSWKGETKNLLMGSYRYVRPAYWLSVSLSDW